MRLIDKNRNFKTGIISILLLITISCSNHLMDMNSSGEVNLTLDALRSVTSDLDTLPVSYRIEGTNLSGDSFDFVTVDTNVQIPDLSPGEWQIRIEAYNESAQVISEGVGTLNVEPGGNASITVILYSLSGSGSLDFSVSWNENLVYNEIVEVLLKNLNGDEIPLNFNQNPGIASGIFDNLPSGFYTLEVKLFDNMILTMGAMELIQIKEGGVTNINLDFSQINKPGQKISVTGVSFTIAWDYDTPSTVDDYRIYYREHGTFVWMYLGSTGSGSILEYTIENSALAYGVYDIAVSSVSGSHESEFHTSMDDSAVPSTGWYIDWS